MLDLVITNVPDRVGVREMLSPKESDVFTDMARCLLNFTTLQKLLTKTKARLTCMSYFECFNVTLMLQCNLKRSDESIFFILKGDSVFVRNWVTRNAQLSRSSCYIFTCLLYTSDAADERIV